MTDPTVLCVDPDASSRETTGTALAEAGYRVVESASRADAVTHLEDERLDCLVTEYDLPDGTGLDVAAAVRETHPDTACVLFTDASPDVIRTADREDVVVEYLPKDVPEAADSLVQLVDNVVAERAQVGYPVAQDEDERLAMLAKYDRPGLAAVESFDRLTTLAKRYFDVDVAFVGLVDAHEERFLACAGDDWETLAREDTMCTHTILEDDLLVVEDVEADPRFAGNDRLDALDVKAYAGVPLRTPRGVAIGAFCLTHDEPRSFSPADRATLTMFADEAMEQLELRRRLVEGEGDPASPPQPDGGSERGTPRAPGATDERDTDGGGAR